MFPLLVLFLLSFSIVIYSLLGYIFFGYAPHEFFLQFLFLSFLPLWYLWQKYIEREETSHEVTRYDLFFTGIVWIAILSLMIFIHPTLASFGIITALLFGVFLQLSSRYLFLIALFGLICSALETALGQRDLAEVFAIYTYYALVAGVVVELVAPLWQKILPSLFGKSLKVEWWHDYKRELQWHMHWIMASLPVFLLIIFSQYLFRETLPMTFHPTSTGVSLLIIALFLALVWVERSLLNLSEKYTIIDIFSVVLATAILWKYFSDDFAGYAYIIHIAMLTLFIWLLVLVHFQREWVIRLAKKLISL